jgi:hypothetical protein
MPASNNGASICRRARNPGESANAPPYAQTAKAQSVEACAGCHIANADNMVFSKFYAPILTAK